MDRWIDDPSGHAALRRVMIAWVLLVMFGLVLVTDAQDDCTLWICEYVPAPTAPYEFCPTVDGYNVTSLWQDWKDGNNRAFDDYGRAYSFYAVDGVWYASSGSYADHTVLVYAGIWWDINASINGLLIFHPSCGVYLQ